jgi:hypothetical protein
MRKHLSDEEAAVMGCGVAMMLVAAGVIFCATIYGILQ